MATIICPQCGFENPEGSSICEICAEPLAKSTDERAQENVRISQPAAPLPTVAQSAITPESTREYFVFCPESQTKTVLPNGSVRKFFCEGCKIEHEIDDFLWQIEMRDKEPAPEQAAFEEDTGAVGDELWLEEVNTHARIDIAKPGGTLGRYGNFGSDFFLSRNMHTVSGEHCRITYEYGSWVLRHISHTNNTVYNGMELEREAPNLLENGRQLTLAGTVTFTVRIG